MAIDAIVDVQVACDDPDTPATAEINRWIAAAVAAADCDDSAIEVSVRVVGVDEIQALNSTYRHQEKPTNVLSFPAEIGALPEAGPRLLGDIVVCAPIVSTEAEQQGKPVASHWAHMLVHGTLHLLGFDHEEDNDAQRMEALETQILTAHGIANPYASP